MLAAAQRQTPPPVNVAPLVLGEMIKGMADKTVVAFVQLKPYTLEARETVAAALAFAAEQGMATEAGRLAPHEMLAWARAIIGSEEAE
jgi:hypothetical protein